MVSTYRFFLLEEVLSDVEMPCCTTANGNSRVIFPCAVAPKGSEPLATHEGLPLTNFARISTFRRSWCSPSPKMREERLVSPHIDAHDQDGAA
jgi:hypothetical protein